MQQTGKIPGYGFINSNWKLPRMKYHSIPEGASLRKIACRGSVGFVLCGHALSQSRVLLDLSAVNCQMIRTFGMGGQGREGHTLRTIEVFPTLACPKV